MSARKHCIDCGTEVTHRSAGRCRSCALKLIGPSSKAQAARSARMRERWARGDFKDTHGPGKPRLPIPPEHHAAYVKVRYKVGASEARRMFREAYGFPL